MTWLSSAATLLSSAETASLSAPVARSFVAPGGNFARDCRLLAVHLETVDSAPIASGDVPGFGCSFVPVLSLVVTFVADCYPVANDQGRPPPPASVTAWTEDFLADVESIWNEIADAALDGILGECSSVSIGQAELEGPDGGSAQLQIPVRLLSI